MYSKHITYFTLSVVVAFAYSEVPPEVLFPTSEQGDTDGESSNSTEIEARHFNNNNNRGNSGTNFPGSNNNYDNSYQGTNYPGNNNNDYNDYGGSSSVGNNGEFFPGSGSNSQGSNGEFFPGSGSNSQGSSGTYYPGNNNNNRPNNNRPTNSGGNGFNNNNRPNNNIPNNSGGNGFNPSQGSTVAFSAIRANTNSNSGNNQQLRFERTVTDVGYGWNSRDSVFECYYPGTYVFSWSAVSPQNTETRLSLYENGRETGHHIWADRNGYQSASETAILNLNRGARIELKLTEGRLYEPSNSGRGYTTFSGFKLN